MPRRGTRALAAGLLIALLPGCRALGEFSNDAYSASNGWFMSNPVTQAPYLIGLAVGFVAALPLTLISWPLTAIFYPSEDGDEFYLSASTCPSLGLGVIVGSALALPFYPLGLPFVPDEPDPQPAEPAGSQGSGGGG